MARFSVVFDCGHHSNPEVGGFYWTVLAPVIVNSEREEQGSDSV
jgi:hypothetical protein